jgi:hypothetical protein
MRASWSWQSRPLYVHPVIRARNALQLFSAVLCSVLLLCGDALAQTGALNKDPTELLKKYLSLDLHGARLEPMSQEALKPYVAWKDEPVWGQVVVVSAFQMSEDLKRWQVLGNLDVIIPVAFEVLGSVYLESGTFLEERKTEEIPFHIKAIGGLWRIVDPMVPPHVSQKRMVNYVRQALVEEKEPSRVEKLTMLRDALRKAR